MVEISVTLRDGTERRLDAKSGLSVMEAIRESGEDELLALCGGCCSCGTCHVYVDAAHAGLLPPIIPDEASLLDYLDHKSAASRLSCQLKINPGIEGLRVHIAPEE